MYSTGGTDSYRIATNRLLVCPLVTPWILISHAYARNLEVAIAGMTESAMNRAPEGKWNSAQILEHLFLTYRGSNRGLGQMPGKRRSVGNLMPR